MKNLLLLALLAVVPVAQADEGDAKTPAETAYEEGFWLETGAGALDRALGKYDEAVGAEGPSAVRARALYRSAVVLQRMGRSEEAVKALERLSKEFPGEKEVLADAKARLDEWNVVDLRTSFEQWYERYRYSPEFQAKILDLVLKLGHATEADAAEGELVAIGAPAIPALRAHAASSSTSIRVRAVAVLLLLGERPDPKAVVESYAWSKHREAWVALASAPEEWRARALAEVPDEPGRAAVLRALVRGPDAIYEIFARRDAGLDQHLVYRLIEHLRSVQPEEAVRERIARIALAEETEPGLRQSLLTPFAEAASIETIASWVARDPSLAYLLARRVVPPDAQRPMAPVLPLLRDPRAGPAAARAIVQRAQNAGWTGTMPWSAEVWRALADAMRSQPHELANLQTRYLQTSTRPMLEVALEDPLAVLPDVLRGSSGYVRRDLPLEETVDRLREGWPAWYPGQRQAYLFAVLAALEAQKDPGVKDFLRGALRDPKTDPSTRGDVLSFLPDLRVDDVRVVYDLADPKAAVKAIPLLARLPEDRETYDAFAGLRRHPDDSVRLDFYNDFVPDEETPLAREVAADMLEDPYPFLRKIAVDRLKARKSSADVPLLVKALGDTDASVRHAAAEALAAVYDRDAILALAKALDDPDADVRQAALASLEAIQKFEDQKKRWKEFAEGVK